ncbi:hypothetical protein [Estrella lausannensis]|uniref:Putative membrane protein n=1 Tax=Estrella lausannensis TaxID=483423 RepID=A0A0H5DRE8_9BACT|nr:hypothetical protein [Estrella lausannensis]CRX38254.1 putative membrane protein [Estrella lausannensis]
MQTITLLNPLSSSYHALEDFKKLKTSQKIITVAITIIAALATVLIGTAAIFRLLVNHYVKKIEADKPDRTPSDSESDSREWQQRSATTQQTIPRKREITIAAHRTGPRTLIESNGMPPVHNASCTTSGEKETPSASLPSSDDAMWDLDKLFEETSTLPEAASISDLKPIPEGRMALKASDDTIDMTSASCLFPDEPNLETSKDLDTLVALQKQVSQSISLASATACSSAGLGSLESSAAHESELIEPKDSVCGETQKIRCMAAFAGLIDDLSQNHSTLPTPDQLGIQLPPGIQVRALRRGDEVVIAIQCPDLTGNLIKDVQEAIAHLHICPLQSHDELELAIGKVNAYLKETKEYELKKEQLSLLLTAGCAELTPSGKSPAGQIIAEAGHGAIIGGAVSTGMGVATTMALAAGGVAAPPVALFIGGALWLTGTAFGATAGLAKGAALATAKAIKMPDGALPYPTFLSAVKAIDSYLTELKKQHVEASERIITTGSGVGGLLSALVGAIHGSEVYCFNTGQILAGVEPGVVQNNLGLKRKAEGAAVYHEIQFGPDLVEVAGSVKLAKTTTRYLDKKYIVMPHDLPVVLLAKDATALAALEEAAS